MYLNITQSIENIRNKQPPFSACADLSGFPKFYFPRFLYLVKFQMQLQTMVNVILAGYKLWTPYHARKRKRAIILFFVCFGKVSSNVGANLIFYANCTQGCMVFVPPSTRLVSSHLNHLTRETKKPNCSSWKCLDYPHKYLLDDGSPESGEMKF